MALRLAASCVFLICVMSFATGQAIPQRVHVSQGVGQASVLKKVDPIYPPLARQARIQGSVILQVVINKSGDVENIQLYSGHPMLAPAAIDAVKQWKYKPYLLNGEPVEVETTVTVSFTLPGVVRVSQGVMAGLLVTEVPPEYPPDAKEQKIQGVVLLRVTIDREGNVSNIELISGHPPLAPAAIEAVKQWKYRPYLLNGSPVEVETQIQVNFTLMH
jgi:TonB family protein